MKIKPLLTRILGTDSPAINARIMSDLELGIEQNRAAARVIATWATSVLASSATFGLAAAGLMAALADLGGEAKKIIPAAAFTAVLSAQQSGTHKSSVAQYRQLRTEFQNRAAITAMRDLVDHGLPETETRTPLAIRVADALTNTKKTQTAHLVTALSSRIRPASAP